MAVPTRESVRSASARERRPSAETAPRGDPGPRAIAWRLLIVALTATLAHGRWQAEWPDAAAVEAFLGSAKVVKREAIGVGVTRSERVTLSDGSRTARAIWKTVDERVPFKRFDDGTFEMQFSDSYKYELAAYELDKLVGFGLVPPVVERRLRREEGSLQLWVENTIMELDRRKRGEPLRDVAGWNRQIYAVRLFHNLTYNTDFNNAGNILSDVDERIYLIDHSRAFRTTRELIAEDDLGRFSERLLDALRELDREALTTRLGRWLSKAQISALLTRRDLILRRADRLIAEKGAAAVLYP